MAWAALVLVAVMPGTARANVGPPSSGGQPVAEPLGVASVSILREQLTIDLRPLAKERPVEVQAGYELSNPHESQTVELAFASGAAGIRGFRVWLDEKPLSSQPRPELQLPASWQPPAETPGLDGRALEYLAYERHDVTPFVFTLTLPPGRSRLTVRYTAEAARSHVGQPTVARQFGYALAPAAAWKSFGGLDLEVHLPAGWQAAVAPSLAREGDLLHGEFEQLPADALALTLQAPTPAAYWLVRNGSLALLVGVVAGGGLVCWRSGGRWGRQHRRRRTRSGWTGLLWLRSLGLGVLWAAVAGGLGVAAVLGADLVLPAGQVSTYGYGKPLALLGTILLAGMLVVIGFSITQIAAAVSHRGRRRSPAGSA